MKKIYVAGAYSADNVLDVLKNIGRGEYYAAKLFAMGFAPFCPWHDKDYVIKNWDKELDKKMFLDASMEWLRVSDAVLVVPNVPGLKKWEDANGVLREIYEAERLNIPVFYKIRNLVRHFQD